MIETRVLITNLWYVTIGDLRTNCNALLLAREEDPHDRKRLCCKMRGFGTEAAWPVFDLALPTIRYELRERPDVLVIADAPAIGLWRDSNERPIVCQTFEWDTKDNPRGERYEEIWIALETSVAEHWHAPYMPRLMHMEPTRALQLPSRAATKSPRPQREI
jgi:hypothetical protein